MRTLIAIALVSSTTWAAAAPLPATAAAALDGRTLVQRGVLAYREAAYAAAVATLEQARATQRLSAEELAECRFYLAASFVALGSMNAARRELRALVDANPGYELPQYTSPKVVTLFREVREEVENRPRLRALPPVARGAVLAVRFEAARTGGTAYGSAFWRWRGERAWRELPLRHGDASTRDDLVGELPLREGTLRAGDPTVELWAEARAPQGLAQLASAERPLEVGVPSAPGLRVTRGSVARSWWLWTIVGAVAAGGAATGLYFALRPTPPATTDATFSFGFR